MRRFAAFAILAFAALACAGKYHGYPTCKKAAYVAMTPISSLVTKMTGWAAIYDLLDDVVKGAIGCCFGMGSVIERSIKKGVMLLRMECGTFRGAAHLGVPLCATYQETRDVKDLFTKLLSRALAPDAWMFIGVAGAASMGEAIKHGIGDPDYPCLFKDLLESGELSPQEIVKMSGDAMHMASFGYFQLYCYSRLRSKD